MPPVATPGTSGGKFIIYFTPDGMKELADAKGGPFHLWGWHFTVRPAGQPALPSSWPIATFEAVMPTLEQATVASVEEIDRRIKKLYAETEEQLVDLRGQRDKLLAITYEVHT